MLNTKAAAVHGLRRWILRKRTVRRCACRPAGVGLGGLCSDEAAGVLDLDLFDELLSGHKVVGHRRRIIRWLFVDCHVRLLHAAAAVLTAAPKVAKNTTVTKLGVQPCGRLYDGQRVERGEQRVEAFRIQALEADGSSARGSCHAP